MGLIEQLGSGTTRTSHELQAYGYPLPQFKIELGRFRLSFHRTLYAEELLKKTNLNERQLKVVAYLKNNNTISNLEYQKIAEVSNRTATRELKELKEKGILVSNGSGRAITYKLK